jgi:hypothetical protein
LNFCVADHGGVSWISVEKIKSFNHEGHEEHEGRAKDLFS